MNDRIKEILDYPTDTPLKFWLKYWDHRIKELCDLDDYGIQLIIFLIYNKTSDGLFFKR